MARQSDSGHVRKICDCVRWKECRHAWYVSYREGKEIGPDGKTRDRGLRAKLEPLVGREPVDYADAKAEARRAIVAWKDGRDARQLIPGDTVTLKTLLDDYDQRPNGTPANKYQRAVIEAVIVNGRKFAEWPAVSITRDMVEAFRLQRPKVGANRDLALLRAAFNWAVLRGLIPATPFKVGTVAAIRLAREEHRTRRLQAGEDELLMLHAGVIKDVVVAALETGCRLGELLSLQWLQVSGAELFLPAGKTQAKTPRRVPLSSVLRGVLDRRRNDPAGEPLPADAYVFGDAVGRQRKTIKTAWKLTCQRAKITGLHFHDLRREAASRWMDAGRPIGTIQRWLGHYNISQTSTYLGASHGNDAEEMAAFERAAGRL